MAKPEISYYNSLCIYTFCHRTDYHKFRWLNHYLTVSRSHKAELKVGFIWGLWSSSNFMFVSRINGRRKWQPTPVLLPGKSHGWRSLVGYSPWGSRRVRHNWATSLLLFTFMHWRRKWQPTPVFLPGESQGWGSLVGCRLWGRTESDTTEAT